MSRQAERHGQRLQSVQNSKIKYTHNLQPLFCRTSCIALRFVIDVFVMLFSPPFRVSHDAGADTQTRRLR